MSKLFNLAKMTTATSGTGTITLGSAVSGFLSFADAGVSDGDIVSYGISDGANSEVGYGTYTASGTTLARTTILKSTNSDAAINLSGTAVVFITVLKENIVATNLQVDQSGGTGDTFGALSGTLNGTNTTFTVSAGSYTSGTLSVYLNGQLQTQGSAEDWIETTPASGIFDFITAPESTDEITVRYGNPFAGLGSASLVINEVPSGTVDGANDEFTLASTPVSGSVSLYRNGLLQKETTDYTISSATITFVAAPAVSSILLASYQKVITTSGNADTLDGVHASALTPIDGWIPISNWTYASATTITVPSGAASIYSIGDKFKLTANSVVLYGYIIGIADTLLTVVGDALTNHVFSATYYSKAATPVGFPSQFSWTPTPTNLSFGNGTLTCSYALNGRVCEVSFKFVLGNTSTVSGNVSVTLPIVPAIDAVGSGRAFDSAIAYYNLFVYTVGTSCYIRANNASGSYVLAASFSSDIPMTWTTDDTIWFSITYII